MNYGENNHQIQSSYNATMESSVPPINATQSNNSDNILDNLDHMMNNSGNEERPSNLQHNNVTVIDNRQLQSVHHHHPQQQPQLQQQQQIQSVSQTLSLTSFLFGNIDASGQLEGDVFEDDVKQHLASLSRLGLGSLLRQVTDNNNDDSDDSEEDDDAEEEQGEFFEKDPNAVDYSDITEAVDDELSSDNQDDPNVNSLTTLTTLQSLTAVAPLEEDYDDEDDDDDDENIDSSNIHLPSSGSSTQSASLGIADVSNVSSSQEEGSIGGGSSCSNEDSGVDDLNGVSGLSKTDQELMPPPPPPLTENGVDDAEIDGSSNTAGGNDALGKKLATPLAAMRPSKYANIDVVELFPDFKADKVLRFSRLFGPNRNTIPLSRSIWKHVKRRKKRRSTVELLEAGETVNDEGFGYSDTTDSDPFTLKFAPVPYIDMTESEERFASPQDTINSSRLGGPGDGGNSSSSDVANRRANNKPKPSDWRFGPAQLWYDMIDIAPQSEHCDYGFKLMPSDVKPNNVFGQSPVKSIKAEAASGSAAAVNKQECNGSHVKTESEGNKPLAGSKLDSSTKSGYEGDSEEEDEDIPDDAFHMITQYNWEDDIIWNGDDLKHKIQQKRKNMAAGWVPSSYNRTAQAFSQPGGSTGGTGGSAGSAAGVGVRPGIQPFAPPPPQPSSATKNKNSGVNGEDDTWYSIFPVENEDLVYSRWEDNIIWDPDNMKTIPEPPILTLDPNDENIILGIPEDVDPATLNQEEPTVKVKIPHPHVKKSKILLGKAGVITTIEEESPPPPPKSPDKDPFNLSNDEYYSAKGTDQIIKIRMGGGLLQHSTPVVELLAPFIPTYMGEKKLRQFHRPPLKRFSHGALASNSPHSVHSLAKEIKKKEKQRDNERLASGGGDVFFMRTPEDLTGKDGDLILVEYIEENPPLLSQVGMCTRIKNYYKRRACNDKGPPEYRFGERSYAHTSPFLGSMHPGQSIQTLENNMYRAPLYEHKIPSTDFLIIRTRHGYNIRECETVFTAGQECPLYEVPGPNSKSANNYVRDFLQVFIYRLFWKSSDDPRRIKMDEIKRAFPTHSESSIRKRLKPCADFKRTGVDSNWWVIKPEFRLPTEEEIRAMVSPEQCSAFGSMLAAEQRLKDAGYGDKFLSALEDENEDDTQKLDDEVKVAPWHTTRAYIHAVKGKCLLQLTGPADPTGCGEGFSYVRIPNKPTQNKEEQEQQPKRTVTGTDADLRRLSLNNAKGLLKEYGVPDEEIKKLSRWEVIDVVRTLSTEKAKAGEEGMNKFSRGNRFSIAEHQERYKEECQRIFDLQNRVLASSEVLSTDEGSSEEEDNDSDMEEKGKYIENILANKKTSTQMSLESEEKERRELQKMMMGDEESAAEKKKQNKKEEDDNSRYGFGTPGRLLKITRTFKGPDGKEYQRAEIVRKTAFIDTYVKIRTTKDETFIKEFVGQLDDVQKEEMKRERRRLQEQLRRIKRNQEKAARGIVTPPRPKKPKLKPDLKLKCGACGQVGHMRTNKACPLYTGPGGGGWAGDGITAGMQLPTGSIVPGAAATVCLDTSLVSPPMSASDLLGENRKKMNSSLDDSLDDIDRSTGFEDSEELINVDGTKIKLSSKLMKHADELKRRYQSSKMRGSGNGDGGNGGGKGNKRRRAGTVLHCDYLKRKNKSVNRRRIDPVITLSTILEEILNQMREMPDAGPFIKPVNAKQVPDYYNLVGNPMDLSTMRENMRQRKYQSREEFMSDVSQIVENSKKYNGEASTLTVTANRMLELCITKFAEQEDKLMRLEKAINPLLDDDDQVAFDYILDNIVQKKILASHDSWPFMNPVNKKNVKDYYDVIENPMDLATVAKKVKNHKYHSRVEFLSDLQLIHSNSQIYNGPNSQFTQKSESLIQLAVESLEEYNSHLAQLESKIAIVRERMAEQAEVDSFVSGEEDEGSIPGGDIAHTSAHHTFAHNLSPQTANNGGAMSADAVTQQALHHLRYSEDDPPVSIEEDDDDDMDMDLIKKPKLEQSDPSEQSRRALMDDLDFSEDEDGGGVAGGIGRDETHGAAEAMMALSTAYQPTSYTPGGNEDGGDVDMNYDPSEAFLGSMGRQQRAPSEERFGRASGGQSSMDDRNVDQDVDYSSMEDRKPFAGLDAPPQFPMDGGQFSYNNQGSLRQYNISDREPLRRISEDDEDARYPPEDNQQSSFGSISGEDLQQLSPRDSHHHYMRGEASSQFANESAGTDSDLELSHRVVGDGTGRRIFSGSGGTDDDGVPSSGDNAGGGVSANDGNASNVGFSDIAADLDISDSDSDDDEDMVEVPPASDAHDERDFLF